MSISRVILEKLLYSNYYKTNISGMIKSLNEKPLCYLSNRPVHIL